MDLTNWVAVNDPPKSEMPNPGLYLNGESINFGGDDYVLHDNKWWKLESKEMYNKYFEGFKPKSGNPKLVGGGGSSGNPKGGIPWTREMRATFAYDLEIAWAGGFKEVGFGGSVFWGGMEYIATKTSFNMFIKQRVATLFAACLVLK